MQDNYFWLSCFVIERSFKMYTLVIAEKPNAAKALVAGLGKQNFKFIETSEKFKPPKAKAGYYISDSEGIIVTYCQGHIVRLKTIEEYEKVDAKQWLMNCLPYVPHRFELTVNDTDRWYVAQLAVIQHLIDRNDIDMVVHFGDPDREGELIIREILGYCNNKHPVKRLWCNNMVPEVLCESYYNLEDFNKRFGLYLEGKARQETDWLLGINVSRYLMKKTSAYFPAGRVLVPIVDFVNQKSKQYNNFKSKQFYTINSVYKDDNKNEFSVNIDFKDNEAIFALEEKDKGLAFVQSLNDKDAKITDIKIKKKTLSPKKLYNLASFQTDMNKKYHFTLKESLNTLQKLYEQGFVTYPRTSVEYLSNKEKGEMSRIVKKLNCSGKNNFIYTDDNKIFNDTKCISGHTALRITTVFPNTSELQNMSEIEKIAYQLIFNRTISNFMPYPVVQETIVVGKIGDYDFKMNGELVLEEGFLSVDKRNIKPQLPEFQVGDNIKISNTLKLTKTAPPQKATPASLLDFLNNPYKDLKVLKDDDTQLYELLKKGATLGTESTTANIIENAKKYGYIVQNKNTLDITKKGENFLELLDKLEINLHKERSIEMNMAIVSVGNRSITLEDNINNIKKELNDSFAKYQNAQITVENEAEIIEKCPFCGGNVIEKSKVFKCQNKDCPFVIFKDDNFFAKFNKKITKSRAKSLIKKGEVDLTNLTSKNDKKYSIKIKVRYKNSSNSCIAEYSTEFINNRKRVA